MYMTCLYVHVHVYDRVSVPNKVVFACTSLEVSPVRKWALDITLGVMNYIFHSCCIMHYDIKCKL